MKRRNFLGLMGGIAACPTIAAAQASPPVMGLLTSANAENWSRDAIRQGLKEAGFIEGQNITVIAREANGQVDKLPALAADLVARKVSVIFATGGPVPTRAAKAATGTIPIVFAYGGDPVADGLVASLSRPGGNVTGATFIGASLSSKRMELLRELVPKATEVGLLVNPRNTLAAGQIDDMKQAVQALGLHLHVVNASTAAEVDMAFKTMRQDNVDVLVVSVDPIFGFLLADQIIALATQNKLPTMWDARVQVTKGGLISYGAVITDTWRQAAIYVGRILKGEKPQDLPVLQPTRFETVINAATAKALGLTLSPQLQLMIDDTIE
ncbi:MAG TPA: ABC transporter substrate-binding protein [Reyranella sp.]|nr:ABC transporter substrate-binding protein [Reyranella sp.]